MIPLVLAAFLLQTPPAQAPAPAARPADEAPLVPGALPESAKPEARALWNSLVQALTPKGETPAPITAFELSITTRVNSVDEKGTPIQENDIQVRFRYLAPGFVSRAIQGGKGDLETMRGPDGDWLWDPSKDDRVRLEGKDYQKDRRELSQTLSIARNYIALANPAKLRIAALERLPAPPRELPPFGAPVAVDSALLRAKQLEWIAVLSPDFHLVEQTKSSAPPLFRVQLGLDPKSHLPLLAAIYQDDHGGNVSETAVLIDFTVKTGEGASKNEEVPRYRTTDGFLVPTYFRVHDPLLPSSPLTFQAEPRMSVVVNKNSTLRAKLAPDDFRPPPPKKK
ncbi:MAG TPA: hypothetical protein VM509_09135 [Planctomycetota bacterium]|nr:hypothetical protein [Planctomycetota bacterium]